MLLGVLGDRRKQTRFGKEVDLSFGGFSMLKQFYLPKHLRQDVDWLSIFLACMGKHQADGAGEMVRWIAGILAKALQVVEHQCRGRHKMHER